MALCFTDYIMKNILTGLIALVFAQQMAAQPLNQARMDSLDRSRIAYIAKYKDLAVLEMYKSGIPASITLAQGLLETASGSSYLARMANNHFGLKCGGNWGGAEIYKNDDEFARDGRQLQSCFRSYGAAAQSFADHSDFLRDPQKHNRYGALFLLDPLDYVAWAEGLQASGYSPVGHYSARLIEHIERYHLHELDYKAWDQRRNIAARHRVSEINGVRVVRAVEGETLAEIALSCGEDISEVVEFNENYWVANTPLVHGTPIFLEAKQPEWTASDLEFFFVHDGKTMFELSQLLGIQLAKLRQMNALTPGQQPAMKAKVRIRGAHKAGEKVALARTSIKSAVPAQPKNKKPPMVPEKGAFPLNAANREQIDELVRSTDEVTTGRLHYHEVSKGETLMAISRKYGTPVEQIKKLNNLKQDTIQVGQRLRVK
jgi:LysM repeat protein